MYYGNYYLPQSERDENAKLIWQGLGAEGFSLNAVAAMLGNMDQESGINPGIWQGQNEGNMEGGFGLVQWTPATKYIDWAINEGYPTYDEYGTLEPQLKRLVYEFNNNIQYSPTENFPLTSGEFRVSEDSIPYLVETFLRNYERAAVETENLEHRIEMANHYYEVISGIPVEPSTPDSKKKKPTHYKFFLFNRQRRALWKGPIL